MKVKHRHKIVSKPLEIKGEDEEEEEEEEEEKEAKEDEWRREKVASPAAVWWHSTFPHIPCHMWTRHLLLTKDKQTKKGNL